MQGRRESNQQYEPESFSSTLAGSGWTASVADGRLSSTCCDERGTVSAPVRGELFLSDRGVRGVLWMSKQIT
jgi:hypothetical protein